MGFHEESHGMGRRDLGFLKALPCCMDKGHGISAPLTLPYSDNVESTFPVLHLCSSRWSSPRLDQVRRASLCIGPGKKSSGMPFTQSTSLHKAARLERGKSPNGVSDAKIIKPFPLPEYVYIHDLSRKKESQGSVRVQYKQAKKGLGHVQRQ